MRGGERRRPPGEGRVPSPARSSLAPPTAIRRVPHVSPPSQALGVWGGGRGLEPLRVPGRVRVGGWAQGRSLSRSTGTGPTPWPSRPRGVGARGHFAPTPSAGPAHPTQLRLVPASPPPGPRSGVSPVQPLSPHCPPLGHPRAAWVTRALLSLREPAPSPRTCLSHEIRLPGEEADPAG